MGLPKPPPIFGFNFNADGFNRANLSPGGQFDFNRTPFEQNRLAQLNNLFGQASGGLLATGPEIQGRRREFENTTFNALERDLTKLRDDSLTDSRESFNASGFLNSTGFEDFRKKNIDEVFSEGLTEAREKSLFAGEQFFNNEQARNLSLLNAAQSGLQQDTTNQLNFGQFANQGFSSVNSAHQSRFQNLLAREKLKQAQKSAKFNKLFKIGQIALGAGALGIGPGAGALGGLFGGGAGGAASAVPSSDSFLFGGL